MIRVPDDDEGKFLVMLTRRGVIKRTALSEYRNVSKNGLNAINLDEGDELAWVFVTDGESDLLIATRNGMSVRFRETDARTIGRTARGVRAVTLRGDDVVVGMVRIEEDKTVLTVSETGYGRRSLPSDYRLQSRGGIGTINYHTAKYGKVAALAMVDETDDVILISSDGIIIRIPVAGISTVSRPGKGVRVMRVNEGERVATMAVLPHEETDDEASAENEAAETDEEPQA